MRASIARRTLFADQMLDTAALWELLSKNGRTCRQARHGDAPAGQAGLYASGEDHRRSSPRGFTIDRSDQAAAGMAGCFQFQGIRFASLLAG
jgi:hypothetical protein